MEPEAVFGAMVPDFASMVRSRVRGVHDARVAMGVALHHRTDDVFHRAPTFVALCADGAATLEARGLGRGSARAVAHVGTELLLDGWLTRRAHGAGAYLAALHAADEPVLRTVELHHDDGCERLRWLLERLRTHGVPRRYDEPAFVGERLAQALDTRPRLRLSATDRETLGPWLTGWRERVHADASALVGHVRRALEASEPAGAES